MTLRLACINIERSKHLDLVKAFLEREQPDVICMQEVLENDCAFLAESCGAADYTFTPMSRLTGGELGDGALFGIGIFVRVAIIAHGERYYARVGEQLPKSDPKIVETYNNHNRMLSWCDVQKDNIAFRILTTHFTWTSDGGASNDQRYNVTAMLRELEQLGEFVLCGDFNAPRTMRDGSTGEIFGIIATRYKDNIPLQYTTSIDGNIHRAGTIPFMVDGLFSTPDYRVSNVILHTGVSDHCAIVAEIENISECTIKPTN